MLKENGVFLFLKNRLRNLKNLLFNVGLSDEEFDVLYPALQEENRQTLHLVSTISTIAFAVLIVVNALMNSLFRSNETAYIVGFAVSLLFCLGSRYLLPSHPKLVMPGTFLFSALLYALFMYISLLHREMPAVSFIVFLLVIPLIFVDRTINLISMTALVSAIFCMLTYRLKPYEIAFTDTWNVVAFAVVAFVEAALLNSVKVRALYQQGEILRLSRTDMLTGARNRNCYEQQLPVYPARATEWLTCVFADVNGLHEVNNRSGHAAGDTMLKTVAEQLMLCFGPEHCYRIGGDEFVAFRTDCPEHVISADIRNLKEVFRKDGYYVSFGVATHSREELKLASLIAEAEKRMYDEKRAYYSRAGFDRRGRGIIEPR